LFTDAVEEMYYSQEAMTDLLQVSNYRADINRVVFSWPSWS